MQTEPAGHEKPSNAPADGKALYLDMMGKMTSYILPCAMQTAGRLGIADALADKEAVSLSDLAAAIDVTDQDGLSRLLRYLIGKDIFELADASGKELKYKNNAASNLLCKDVPMSLWGLSCHLFDTTPVWQHVPAWLRRKDTATPCSPWGMHYGKVRAQRPQTGCCARS